MTRIADTLFKEVAGKDSLEVGYLTSSDLVPVFDASAGVFKMVAINDFATDADIMEPAAGFISGTGTVYKSSVTKVGTMIITRIYIDLTGAQSVATDKDIIGDTGVAHIGQVTAAVNGNIMGGLMRCLEVPLVGADDIDLYSADEGTGEEDGGIAALAETALIVKGGAWAIDGGTAFGPVVDNQYLYLVAGEADAGVYTAGKFLIELFGIAA
jgi:hypothetical protein